MAAIGLEVVGSKVRTSKMPQQLRRRRGLGPLVIKIFVGSCKHQEWQHLGRGCDRLVSTAGIIFDISPYYLLSCRWSFCHSCPGRLATWLKLGSQVGSTTYHLSSCFLSNTSMIQAQWGCTADIIASYPGFNSCYHQFIFHGMYLF